MSSRQVVNFPSSSFLSNQTLQRFDCFIDGSRVYQLSFATTEMRRCSAPTVELTDPNRVFTGARLGAPNMA
jgi:hypothetical protein